MVKTALRGLVGIEQRDVAMLPRRHCSSRNGIAALLAGLACMGGLIHLGAAVDHAGELALYVLVFVFLALAQFTWAAMVLRNASDRVLRWGCVLNACLIALWALSRTVGLPIAPQSWVPEPVGFADLIETIGEMAVLLGAWSLLAAPRLSLARHIREHATAPVVTMLAVSALFGVGAHAG